MQEHEHEHEHEQEQEHANVQYENMQVYNRVFYS